MRAPASLVDTSVLIAVGCLLAQARSALSRIFYDAHWSIVPTISIAVFAAWVGALWLWQTVDELTWQHDVLGATICLAGLVYLQLKHGTGSVRTAGSTRSAFAHGALLADCLVAFTLTMVAAYFLLVVEVRLTNGELTQAIMQAISETPELAGYLLGQ
jgi:hypothetical protein